MTAPPLIWALGFANPALLYGLAAASVPILIHLLNRRKYREVPWAAMRFLLAAVRKNRRRVRVEQWLLLAVRTLIILLVVAAMARPFLESMGVVIVGRRVHRVLVLDASDISRCGNLRCPCPHPSSPSGSRTPWSSGAWVRRRCRS